ncbi:hypothetical protein A9Q99_13870 [Gammaproteobacteria bacterium 45_16_T64]|nr:hypothetical protein A9Q99_13870 [Gammaproteobacteria bacterium 45_16_T64]
MKNVFKPLLIGVVVGGLVNGCGLTPHSEQLKYAPLQKQERKIVVETAATYLREVTPEEESLQIKVSYVGTATLIDAIREQLPKLNIMPADDNVDLLKMVSIYANKMPLEDYMAYLSALTGYDISLEGNMVWVRSFVEKEWNVAMFSSTRNVSLKAGEAIGGGSSGSDDSGSSSGGGSGNNTVSTSSNEDEWEIIVDATKAIVLEKDSSEKKGMSPYVQALRSVGTLSVGGSPRRVEAVDQFVKNVMAKGTRQVNISVQAYDVVLDDSRAAGIDWSALSFSKVLNGNQVDSLFSASNSSVFSSSVPMNTQVSVDGKYFDGSFMLNFLNQFGEVELLNQPNITVRNGVYAYISTGEELSYVGKVTREFPVNSLGVAQNTGVISEFEPASVRVGVTLAVVPRILDDERIMLDIWPVVSTKSGDFTIGDIQIPNLSLHDMSTQVIVKNGQSIQLGGFIRRSIAKKLQNLPWKEKLTGMLVNPLFESESDVVERRELVLTVTPTVIDEI